MKISFLIPVYNLEQYLPDCLESILSHSFSGCEIILVDDGSTDKSPEICDKYASDYGNVSVFHIKNSGVSAARNVALKYAKGEYVFFFDGDDYLVNDNISKLYETAKENNLDILHNTYYCTANDEVSKLSFTENKLYAHEDMLPQINVANMNRILIFAWRNLYKKSFLTENGILFSEELRIAADPVFNMNCFVKCKRFMAVNMPVYCYRIREQSIQRVKYKKDYYSALQKQWELKNKYFHEGFSDSTEYDKDSAEFTIKVLLPIMLGNEYENHRKNRYKILKNIANSEMLIQSFKNYDIRNFKSRSLDWLMTYFMYKKLYFGAHLICNFILYK